MIAQAYASGDLANETMSLRSQGKATRVFTKAVYLEFPDSLVVILNGGLKSPITINVSFARGFQGLVKLGDGCRAAPGELVIGDLAIALPGSRTYANRLDLARAGELRLSDLRALRRAAAVLRLLYQASPGRPLLPEDDNLGRFISSLSVSRSGPKDALRGEYALLLGRGNGFTPSGDDFLAGFTATYNHVAKRIDLGLIELEFGALVGKTVRESAMLLWYASRGHVDEEMEDLMLSLSSDSPGLTDALVRMAARGHTSGLDMSLGALVAVAAVRDLVGESGDGAVRSVMGALAP